MPVGTVGVVEVSLTVAVQLTVEPAAAGFGVHETLVVVAWAPPAGAWTTTVVEPELPV